MKKRLWIGILLSAVLAVLLTAGAAAEDKTIYVSQSGTGDGTSGESPTTLANAVSTAVSGDTICIMDDITVSSTVTVDKSLTFQGMATGETKPTISTGSHAGFSIFSLTASDVSLNFQNLTFDGSGVDNSGKDLYGGAISANGSTTSLNLKHITLSVGNCDFRGFEAHSGGAIGFRYIDGGSIHIFANSSFSENKADVSGGAVGIQDCEGINLSAYNSKFENNISNAVGGAIGLNGSAGNNIVLQYEITDCYFSGNQTYGSLGGGALGFKESMSVDLNIKISNTNFVNNSTYNTACGGALYILSGDFKLNLDTCAFTQNNSAKYGGAVYLAVQTNYQGMTFHGDVTMQKIKFEENYSANQGGALHLGSGGINTNFSRALFKNNSADHGLGNAILYFYSSNATTTSAIYPTDGVAFESNGGTLETGDTIYLQGSNGSDDKVIFSDYMLDGTRTLWKTDGKDADGNDILEPLDREIYANFDLGQYSGSLYLDESTAAPTYSYDDYSVLFINNRAGQYGGAICNYGSLTIGEPGEDITVTKIWSDEEQQEHDPVTVNLVRKSDQKELDSLSLGAENSWTGTFYGFPTNVAYTITENKVADYASSVSYSGDTVTVTNTKQAPTYSLTYNANYGDNPATIDSGPYEAGTTMTLNGSNAFPRDGYKLVGWNTAADGSGTSYAPGGTFIMPDYEVILYAQWEQQYIAIRPADITIYMGGTGYEGVVDSDGQLVTNEEQLKANGFPEPAFFITLPDTLQNIDVTSELTLIYKGKNNEVTYQWKFEKYGAGDHDVYRIVPMEVTDKHPVRMQFTIGETVVTDDQFNVAQYINQALTMKVYGEGINQDRVRVIYAGNEYPIDIQYGTLTVRGTTAGVQTAAVTVPESFVAEKGKPGIFAPGEIIYTINGSPVQVDLEDASIALLFDGIIDSYGTGITGGTYTQLLKDKVDAVIGSTSGTTRYYDYRYLNLVDTNNGNTWVKASNSVTIYWPLPDGTSKDTQFTLLHFADLHRSMSPEAIISTLTSEDYMPTEVPILRVTDTHVVFEVPSGEFSPFVLVGETEQPTYIPPYIPPEQPVEPILPEHIPDGLNTEDHYAYIAGYEDGTVRPESSITRAEVATIFFRLLTDETRAAYWSQQSNYSDVAPGSWYTNAICTLSSMGILEGYEDGTFRPDTTITRAEFAKIAVSFFDWADTVADNPFVDVAPGAWYERFVTAAAKLGLIEGYTDQTFRPKKDISRAEVCTIVNRVLGRAPDKDHLLSASVMITWPDNLPTAWYYSAMQEATNSHDYTWTNVGQTVVEQWTAKLAERDWAALEKEWSTAYSAPGSEVMD